MSVWKTDKKKLLIFASLISPSKIILFEKWYQVFHHQINHLEVLQKHSAAHVVFSMRLSSMFHLVKKPVGWGGGGGPGWNTASYDWYITSQIAQMWCLDDRSIHVQFSKRIQWMPFDFLKFDLWHFTPQVKLFLLEKENPNFSDSKMRWRKEPEKFLLRKALDQC